MSFLVALLKPVAYASLPIFLLRYIASTSPYAHYLIRLGLYTATMAASGAFGFISSLGMSAVGQKYNVNYVVARTFYYLASTIMGITVELEGGEHMKTRPAVFVANHQSMLDILILGRIFPKQASIMSKKELQWSALGPFMSMSGTVFVDRGNSAKAQRSLEAAGEAMRTRATSLFIFAEGTRHSAEVPSLLPFKKGAFHLAVQAGLPIVPVVTENYWRLYRKGQIGYGPLKVKVLPPIPTTSFTAADVSDLAVRVREQMLETLREISVKVASPAGESGGAAQASAPADPPAATSSEPAAPTATAAPSAPTPKEEETSSTSSEAGKSSENGTETEEDEGMVLVGRPA